MRQPRQRQRGTSANYPDLQRLGKGITYHKLKVMLRNDRIMREKLETVVLPHRKFITELVGRAVGARQYRRGPSSFTNQQPFCSFFFCLPRVGGLPAGDVNVFLFCNRVHSFIFSQRPATEIQLQTLLWRPLIAVRIRELNSIPYNYRYNFSATYPLRVSESIKRA